MKTALRYAGEPYVSPADVYSNPQHTGRCGWTWYTGSAAWMYRVWIESILGFRVSGDFLSIDPALPDGWNDFEVHYRHGAARYRIRVQRDAQVRRRQTRIDNQTLEGDRIPLSRSPAVVDIIVRLPVQRSAAASAGQEPLGVPEIQACTGNSERSIGSGTNHHGVEISTPPQGVT